MYDDYRPEWAASKEGPSFKGWLAERESGGWRHDGRAPQAFFDNEGAIIRYRFIQG